MGKIRTENDKITNASTTAENRLIAIAAKANLEQQLDLKLSADKTEHIKAKNNLLVKYIDTRYIEQKSLFDNTSGALTAKLQIKEANEKTIQSYTLTINSLKKTYEQKKLEGSNTTIKEEAELARNEALQ